MALVSLLSAVLVFCSVSSCSGFQHQAKRSRPSVLVSGSAPSDAGTPLEAFVSFSIEFSFFPDYAGNASNPNYFSNNLLNNIADFQGTKPYIRVGGATQDKALFVKEQKQNIINVWNYTVNQDQPSYIYFGPAFFQSYHTWPGSKYIHGYNLRYNTSSDRQALLESVPYACHALQNGLLEDWQLGNEPDSFTTGLQSGGSVWPAKNPESAYVSEWQHWSNAIRGVMREACPEMATDEAYKYYAPSLSNPDASLNPVDIWEDDFDKYKDIEFIDQHNYITGAMIPGVTLQGTLMNHSAVMASVALLVNESSHLAALPYNLNPDLPFILGETNSLYGQGLRGVSNAFGAALWAVDYNLWCLTNNIRRTHMHQGTDYRYQAWQPIVTSNVTIGTKAPYYGNIAVAAFLGDTTPQAPKVSVANLRLPSEEESAYAAYVGGELRKVIVINMREYNATDYNVGYIDNYPRPSESYTFQFPETFENCNGKLQWLMANGSDALSGVTFDGYSYNWELDNGKPVLLQNVTRGETVKVGQGGQMTVEVPSSSAVIINFGESGW